MTDPGRTRDYFDRLAEGEWERLEATPRGRISAAIHRQFLHRHILPGMHVADIGCGPGRFAIDMLRAGARVTLADISGVQLRLAGERISNAGLSSGLEGAYELDVRDLGRFSDASFDAVVCYGGAISYAYDDHARALAEVVRIAGPDAPILLSVMSLHGTLALMGTLDDAGFLESLDDHIPRDAVLDGRDVVLTRPHSREFHQPLALFTSRGLARGIRNLGCEVMTLAAANPISHLGQALERVAASPAAESSLTFLETAICEEPGMVDSGQHLIAVARRRS